MFSILVKVAPATSPPVSIIFSAPATNGFATVFAILTGADTTFLNTLPKPIIYHLPILAMQKLKQHLKLQKQF